MRQILAVVIGGALVAPALGSEIVRTWPVQAAFNDLFGTGGPDGHALWFANELFPGGGRSYVLTGGLGTLEERDVDLDGFGDELLLYGRVESVDDPNYAFDMEMAFTETAPASGSPKKELLDAAYSENGGPVDTDDWTYYALDSQRAVLQGSGLRTQGQTLNLIQFPTDGSVPFQLGLGANGKNAGMGFAGWFGFTINDVLYHGDVNIDLVPEPVSILLLAVGGLTFVRRRG